MQTTDFLINFATNISQLRPEFINIKKMRKKYLLWGYAVIAVLVIGILSAIAISSFMGIKGARNAMSNPENRKAIYDTAAKVNRDTGLGIPSFEIKEHKPGEYQEGNVFRDTLIVYFYKGIPDSVFTSFEKKAQLIEAKNDSSKSVETDGTDYNYQDFYVGGFSCYIGVHISRNSPYGRIIYGNWKEAKE